MSSPLEKQVCVSSAGNTCQALIVGTHEDHIDVKVQRATCAGCQGRCLGQLITHDNGKSIRLLRQHIESQHGDLAVGDSVDLSVSRGTLIGLSSLAYLVPVVLMLLFAVVCYGFISRSESMVACMAVIGLIAGLVGCKFATRWYSAIFGPGIRVLPHQ